MFKPFKNHPDTVRNILKQKPKLRTRFSGLNRVPRDIRNWTDWFPRNPAHNNQAVRLSPHASTMKNIAWYHANTPLITQSAICHALRHHLWAPSYRRRDINRILYHAGISGKRLDPEDRYYLKIISLKRKIRNCVRYNRSILANFFEAPVRRRAINMIVKRLHQHGNPLLMSKTCNLLPQHLMMHVRPLITTQLCDLVQESPTAEYWKQGVINGHNLNIAHKQTERWNKFALEAEQMPRHTSRYFTRIFPLKARPKPTTQFKYMHMQYDIARRTELDFTAYAWTTLHGPTAQFYDWYGSLMHLHINFINFYNWRHYY